MTPQFPPGQEGPLTQLPPLANPFVQAGPPQPPQPLPQTPPPPTLQESEPEVYKIDPLVLDRRVKIRVDGASRMVTKDLLAQTVQSWLPIIGNGPFMQGLMSSGQTFDWPVFFKMAQDATGTGKLYPFIRPMNQQEEQRSQQPPPQVRAQMQKTQADGQVRTQLSQDKLQAERERIQSDAQIKHEQISEESARHILKLLMESQNNGAEAKQAESQAKVQGMQQEGQLKLQHLHQEHQLKMQQAQQKGSIDTQLAMQKGAVDTHLGHQKLAMQSQQNQMDMQSAQAKHHADLAKAKSILAQGKAKAESAKMQPKPTAKPAAKPAR